MSLDLSPPQLPSDELARLEEAVEHAFASGDESGLEVLGYGEISCVIAWEVAGRRLACKRLPPFPDEQRLAAYRDCFHDYLAALAAGGVEPVPSSLAVCEGQGGRPVAWCVQPVLPAEWLVPTRLRSCSRADASELAERVVDRVCGCVGVRLGLDGQLSNWAQLPDGQLRYLDVTTPLLRDEDGAERLDTGLFIAALPWALRGLVRRFMLGGIIDKYYRPRDVVLDLLGNMLKERLDEHLGAFVEHLGPRFTPPIELSEVERYYRGDARTWALLLRLRRVDRWWQRKVRRRVYPFLLPGPIQR